MRLPRQLSIVVVLTLAVCTSASPASENTEHRDRDGKLLPLFQVVKFNNDFCSSTSNSRNGTCYTKSECSNLGGTSGSSCAEGFGVCCTFELTCGGSSSQNATYIINTSPTKSCTYEICPASSEICRVRFDFESFTLTNPQIGTAQATGGTTRGGAIGDCITDQFSIDGPNQGSPVICGKNTGQHMILDSDGSTCHNVQALIDTATTGTTRTWTIHVSQYTCQNRYGGGPPGCLQYFYDQGLSKTGVMSNFGYDRSQTSIAVTTTHLSNQQYNICIRRMSGCHSICYYPTIAGSFGLSVATIATTANAQTLSNCITDYLSIPGGSASAIAATYQEANASQTVAPTANRVCGRIFGTQAATATQGTICSRVVPFVVGVTFDADELTGTATAILNEQDTTPGGIIGFHLTYVQNC